MGGTPVRQHLLDDVQRVARAFFQDDAAGRADNGAVPVGNGGQRRMDADEAVATEDFAFFDGLQQEAGTVRTRAQFEIDRDGRFEIGGQLEMDGDHVALLRQGADLVKTRLVDLLHTSSWVVIVRQQKTSSRHTLPVWGRGRLRPAVPPRLDRPTPTKNPA